jgi:hypothetical protein
VSLKPIVFAFTLNDWKAKNYPIVEWLQWHAGVLGLRVFLLYVGSRDEELEDVAYKAGAELIYTTEKPPEGVDYRAFYKQLALSKTPGDLKVMLDIDEFLLSGELSPRQVPSPGKANYLMLYTPTTDLEHVWVLSNRLEAWRRLMNRKATERGLNIDFTGITPYPAPIKMPRVFWNQAKVIGDGGQIDLPIDTDKSPVEALHLTWRCNWEEFVKKTWLWILGLSKIREKDIPKFLPVRKARFSIPSELREILEEYMKGCL